MFARSSAVLILLLALSEGRPCFSISDIPPGRDQVYLLTRDSVIIDSNGVTMDALILTTRTIRYTGSAFLVIDTLRLRAGNPYPYHRETVIVRRDSGTAPPRELDFCTYADSAETVIAHEDDSLYVAFLGERAQGNIRAVFSLKEGLLYFSGSVPDSSFTASRSDEEGVMKSSFAMSEVIRQAGIPRAAKGRRKPMPRALPGFAFGNYRFDASGRRLARPLP